MGELAFYQRFCSIRRLSSRAEDSFLDSRNATGVIQQFLAVCQITACLFDLISEDDEAFRSIGPSQSDNHQCAISHILRCTWQTLRQKSERVVRTQIFARYPNCCIVAPEEGDIEWGPSVSDPSLILVYALQDIGTDACYVNV
jgi:hypothetical protein